MIAALRRAVSDAGVAGRDRAFPELVATSRTTRPPPAMLDVRERLRSFERPCARALLRQRPDLHAARREVMAELICRTRELDPPLEGAGHFLQEDRGEAVGARIAAWLA